jgi:hypothetical protein
MPNVSGKKFSYDKAGMKAAAEYAKKTGKPMKKAKPKVKKKK